MFKSGENGMNARRQIVLALIAIFACMGASSRTTNFVVHAPNQQVADLVGQWAEHYRKEKAILWLGKEMPPWPQPCPLYVTVDMSGPSGATSFNFGQDQYGKGMVLGMKMEIQGPLDRLIHSVLPHEITHTVFAFHFKRPVPRWADEGGSVLSEDDVERIRHDKLVRSILNGSQQIQMRQLFGLTEYPQGKVMHLYAQGYSVTNYLVMRSGRQQFLNFLGHGMTYGWDNAAMTYYKHRTVEELEGTWLEFLKETKGMNHIEVSQGKMPTKTTTAAAAVGPKGGTTVRLTVPPGTFEPDAVARGQAPDEDDAPKSPYAAPTGYGSQQIIPAAQFAPGFGSPGTPTAQPKYLPDYPPSAGSANWPAPGAAAPSPPPYQPASVQLGAPQYLPTQPGMFPAQEPMSPVGLPK
jgi:hypothetical protein